MASSGRRGTIYHGVYTSAFPGLSYVNLHQRSATVNCKLVFTADQLVAHAVGDYILQSDWMAAEKTQRSLAAAVHVVFYTLPFLFITQNPYTLAVIAGTHFVIDRWYLARYVAWLKNWPWPGSRPWSECRDTGFAPDVPAWKAGWLVVVVDNILHITINGMAIHWIG